MTTRHALDAAEAVHPPRLLAAGFGVAALILAPHPLASSAGATYLSGHDGLWLGLGVALGLTLAGTLVTGPIARSGCATFTDFVAARFGPGTARAVMLVAAISLVLLTAGQLASLAPVATLAFGASPTVAALAPLAIVATAVAAVLAGSAVRLALAATGAATAIFAVIVHAAAMTTTVGAQLPIAYGALLQEISRLELALIGQKLADVTTIKAHATPYVTLDQWGFFGALIGAAGGMTALAVLAPGAASRARGGDTRREADTARGRLAWALVLVLPLLLAMPAIAIATKLALYRFVAGAVPTSAIPEWLLALSRDGLATVCGRTVSDVASVASACKSAAGNKGVLRLQDIGIDAGVVWLVGGHVAGLPAAIAALPLFAAAAGVLAAITAALGGLAALVPAEPSTDARPRAYGPLAAIAGVIAASALAGLTPDQAAALSWWVLPLLASTLLPLAIAGVWWRRATPAGALAGLLVGGGLTLYYLVGTRYFPVGFYDLWQSLSHAGVGAERRFVALRQLWTTADDPAKAAAWQALAAHARGMASWWGVKPVAAAVLGLPASLLALIFVSLATGRRDVEVEVEVDRLLDRAHLP